MFYILAHISQCRARNQQRTNTPTHLGRHKKHSGQDQQRLYASTTAFTPPLQRDGATQSFECALSSTRIMWTLQTYQHWERMNECAARQYKVNAGSKESSEAECVGSDQAE